MESVRLIFVVLFAAGGYTVATRLNSPTTGKTLVGVVLGSATGFVLGGAFGRQTATAIGEMEREFRQVPAPELVEGMAGLLIGLVVAALMSVPLFRLPPLAAWTTVAFAYVTLGYLGYRVGRLRQAELFGLIGLKPRSAGAAGTEISVVGTSALIDGCVVDLARTGFLTRDLLIRNGVLREPQTIANSSDVKLRSRGRSGLDAVAELQRAPTVQVHLVDEAGVVDVDAALLRLARDRGASLIMTDHKLAKVAEALCVPDPRLNDLAAAFRVPVEPGGQLVVGLVRAGREHGQAVGYLEDSTMVVAENASERVGREVPVVARQVIQTVTGRMIFAQLEGSTGS